MWATFRWRRLRLLNSVFSAALGKADQALYLVGIKQSRNTWLSNRLVHSMNGLTPLLLQLSSRQLIKLLSEQTDGRPWLMDSIFSMMDTLKSSLAPFFQRFKIDNAAEFRGQGRKRADFQAPVREKEFVWPLSLFFFSFPLYAAINLFPMGVCDWTLEPRNLCPLWPPLPIHTVAHWRQTVIDSRSDSVESVFSKQHRLWGLRWRPAWWSLLPPGEWRAGTTITAGVGTPLGVRWKRNLNANRKVQP